MNKLDINGDPIKKCQYCKEEVLECEINKLCSDCCYEYHYGEEWHE